MLVFSLHIFTHTRKQYPRIHTIVKATNSKGWIKLEICAQKAVTAVIDSNAVRDSVPLMCFGYRKTSTMMSRNEL